MPSIEQALQSLIKENSHSFKNGQATYPEDFDTAKTPNNAFLSALLSQHLFIAINKIQGQDAILATKNSSGSPAMPCFTSKEELHKFFDNASKKFDYIRSIEGFQAFKNADAMKIDITLNPSSEHTIVFPSTVINSTLSMHKEKGDSIAPKSKISIKVPSSKQYSQLQNQISEILGTINEVENAYLVLLSVGDANDFTPTVVIELNVPDSIRRECFERIISSCRSHLDKVDDFDMTFMGDDLAFDSAMSTKIKPFYSRKKRILH